MNEIKPDFLDQEALEKMIREKANSKNYWIIPAYSFQGHELVYWVEKSFYMKDNNEKFELLMGKMIDGNFGAIAIAEKSEMSKEDLEGILKKKIDAEADFILSTDTPYFVIDWLKRVCHD